MVGPGTVVFGTGGEGDLPRSSQTLGILFPVRSTFNVSQKSRALSDARALHSSHRSLPVKRLELLADSQSSASSGI